MAHGLYPHYRLPHRWIPLRLHGAHDGPQTALIVLIGYILINGSVENFYKPKVMGDRLKISPVIVLIDYLSGATC